MNSKPIKKWKKENVSAWLLLLPALITFSLFKYYPIFLGFYVSLYKLDIVNPPGHFVGFANYIRVFKDPEFYNSFQNNAEFLLICLLINFWVPILLAVLINEVRHGKTLFRTLYFIPSIAPGIAVMVLWKYIWQPDYGLANYLLRLIGIAPQMWLNDPALVKWCMSIPGLLCGGGMTMVIYLAALQDIPQEQYDSALIEGASFTQKLRYIAIPQISTIINIMFILTLIGTFNSFDGPMIMTGGGPIGSTETMILYSYKVSYRDHDYSYGITISMVVFAFVFLLTFIQMKLKSKNETRG